MVKSLCCAGEAISDRGSEPCSKTRGSQKVSDRGRRARHHFPQICRRRIPPMAPISGLSIDHTRRATDCRREALIHHACSANTSSCAKRVNRNFHKKCPLLSTRVPSCPLLSHSSTPSNRVHKNPCYNRCMKRSFSGALNLNPPLNRSRPLELPPTSGLSTFQTDQN